jgi:hypothetical protein
MIPDFKWSGIKLAVWPPTFLLAITYVLNTQMFHASLFKIPMFQYLSNGIGNFSIKWVLALKLSSNYFKNPSGLQFSKWEFTWEYGGSFLHPLLHSQEHKMWLRASLLARTFASPCFGCKPKARVPTIKTFQAAKEFHPLTL